MQAQEYEEHAAAERGRHIQHIYHPGPPPFQPYNDKSNPASYTFQRMKYILTKIISQSFNINLV